MPRVDFELLEWPTHDIQDLVDIPDDAVDVLATDMVLEHVPDVEAAIRESRRVVRPGGLVIHTTVFMMPYHPCPDDYRRFSPSELTRLFREFTAIHDVGGFGNRRAVAGVLARLTRVPVPWPWGGPLAWALAGNDPKFPICTWVIARV
jgi:SAM-dependent methyltransferase